MNTLDIEPNSLAPETAETVLVPGTRPRGRPRKVDAAAAPALDLSQEYQLRRLGCQMLSDWCQLILENKLPFHFSPRIDIETSEKSWNGWKSVLGLPREPSPEELAQLPQLTLSGYIEFPVARAMAQTLQCADTDEWFFRMSAIHPCVPREPWKIYYNQGFTTLEEFLGIPLAP